MQVTKSASENACTLDKGILPIQVISIEAAQTHEAEFIEIWKNADDRYIFCCYAVNYDWIKTYTIRISAFGASTQEIIFNASDVIKYSTECVNFLVWYIKI